MEPINVYVDGSCMHQGEHIGSIGAGIHVPLGSHAWSRSLYLGQGTANYAELAAIGEAVELFAALNLPDPVHIYSDSQIAISLAQSPFKGRCGSLYRLARQIHAQLQNSRTLIFLHWQHDDNKQHHVAHREARRAASTRQGSDHSLQHHAICSCCTTTVVSGNL